MEVWESLLETKAKGEGEMIYAVAGEEKLGEGTSTTSVTGNRNGWGRAAGASIVAAKAGFGVHAVFCA